MIEYQTGTSKESSRNSHITGISIGFILCLISMNVFSRSIVDEAPTVTLNDSIGYSF